MMHEDRPSLKARYTISGRDECEAVAMYKIGSRRHACKEVVDVVAAAEGNARVNDTVGCSVAEVCNSLQPYGSSFTLTEVPE